MPFLSGEVYRSLCDVAWSPGQVLGVDDRVVFCRNDMLDGFLGGGHGGRRCVLVSGMCDIAVDDALASRKPPNVVRWFAHNRTCNHPLVEAMPLGVGNEFNGPGTQDAIQRVRGKNASGENLLLAAFAINTNPAERMVALAAVHGKKWATEACFLNHGGHVMDFDAYLWRCRSHIMVLSPPGNGVDCHRTWETIYAGSIPVVKRSRATCDFSDLPILLVDDWNQLTLPYLMGLLVQSARKGVNIARLTPEYWSNRFRSALKETT